VFPAVQHWANFVCEACTVRSVVDRELGALGDKELLLLERMRIIDIAHSWSPGTHVQYQSKLGYLRLFERRHPGLHILSALAPPRPPSGPVIPLMWAEEAYSLKQSNRRGDARVTYGTIRQLRAAASQFHMTGLINGHTGTLQRDQQGRISRALCRPTDDASLKHFTDGLSARIGNESRPSVALLDRHIRALNEVFEARYLLATSDHERQLWASAGLANVLLWLGWLRASELFNLTHDDLEIIEPGLGPSRDLPSGMGAVILHLSPETKSSRSTRADVVIAYRTVSGHRPGLWAERLTQATAHLPRSSRLFVHKDGRPWDSNYFRHLMVYPVLDALRANGDAYLLPYTDIPRSFYSLHCYRRGARTQASKLRGSTTQRASPDQIYEHGRWRKSRASERIDIIYREWPLYDRLLITLLCM
jgi:hypothetical protein